MNYIDLFSGIGGFALGLKQSGISIKNHYFSDIDKYAVSVYKKHFPNAKGLGDVKTIKSFSKLGHIDLITFGFPCQDLSIAGKGKGFDGDRSSLFYEATRIIHKTKPTYFIFENVKGLLSHDDGRTFEKVLQEIANLGIYDCEWQLINTSWFLPQNRERIYFIGHLRKQSGPKVFPITESSIKNTNIQGQNSNTITARYGNSVSTGTFIIDDEIVQETKKNGQGNRINTVSSNSVYLSANGGGQGGKTGLYVVPRGVNPGGYKEVTNAPTITSSRFEQNNFIYPFKPGYDGINVRKLTPVECERLQGFPDDWTSGHSDSQRYKMLGNAVSVPITKHIFKTLLNRECNI